MGRAVGAAVVVRLEDWLSTSGFDGIGMVTGGIFVLVVLLFRRGLFGSLQALLDHLVHRRRP